VTLDGIYYRTDRLKELGLKEPTPDWCDLVKASLAGKLVTTDPVRCRLLRRALSDDRFG